MCASVHSERAFVASAGEQVQMQLIVQPPQKVPGGMSEILQMEKLFQASSVDDPSLSS